MLPLIAPSDGIATEIVMFCWNDLEAAAGAADPCLTEPACVELEKKLYAEAGADIYVRVRRERDRLGLEPKIMPKRKGEPTYE
jgi:hypothetical protein